MFSKMTVIRAAVVCIASQVIVLAGPAACAQAAPATPTLLITILDGEGALNDIRQRTAREPIVQVEDENHRPIAGAAVLFALPGSGPSGTFAAGAQTFSTVTDNAGRAIAHGLHPNSTPGSYTIHVRVSFNGSTRELDIHQQNTSGQSSETQQSAPDAPPVTPPINPGGTPVSSGGSGVAQHLHHGLAARTIWIVVAAGAAAGTAGAIIATQGGNATTITAGGTTVGAPQATGGIRIPLRFHSR